MTERPQVVGGLISRDAPIYACGVVEEGHQCGCHLYEVTPQKPSPLGFQAYCERHGDVYPLADVLARRN